MKLDALLKYFSWNIWNMSAAIVDIVLRWIGICIIFSKVVQILIFRFQQFFDITLSIFSQLVMTGHMWNEVVAKLGQNSLSHAWYHLITLQSFFSCLLKKVSIKIPVGYLWYLCRYILQAFYLFSLIWYNISQIIFVFCKKIMWLEFESYPCPSYYQQDLDMCQSEAQCIISNRTHTIILLRSFGVALQLQMLLG